MTEANIWQTATNTWPEAKAYGCILVGSEEHYLVETGDSTLFGCGGLLSLQQDSQVRAAYLHSAGDRSNESSDHVEGFVRYKVSAKPVHKMPNLGAP